MNDVVEVFCGRVRVVWMSMVVEVVYDGSVCIDDFVYILWIDFVFYLGGCGCY